MGGTRKGWGEKRRDWLRRVPDLLSRRSRHCNRRASPRPIDDQNLIWRQRCTKESEAQIFEGQIRKFLYLCLHPSLVWELPTIFGLIQKIYF
jgi:hypothetical protein